MKATPHIEVTEEGKIAKTVLMPGDPLRAEYIAKTYLENVEQFNHVRGMNGYTGTYKGRKISVMGSGMGIHSTQDFKDLIQHFRKLRKAVE